MIRPLAPIPCPPLLLPYWQAVLPSYLNHFCRYLEAGFGALYNIYTRICVPNSKPIRPFYLVLHLYQFWVSLAVILSVGSISPRSGRIRIRRAFKTRLKHALNTLPAAHSARVHKNVPEYERWTQTEKNATKITKFHGVLGEIWYIHPWRCSGAVHAPPVSCTPAVSCTARWALHTCNTGISLKSSRNLMIFVASGSRYSPLLTGV